MAAVAGAFAFVALSFCAASPPPLPFAGVGFLGAAGFLGAVFSFDGFGLVGRSRRLLGSGLLDGDRLLGWRPRCGSLGWHNRLPALLQRPSVCTVPPGVCGRPTAARSVVKKEQICAVLEEVCIIHLKTENGGRHELRLAFFGAAFAAPRRIECRTIVPLSRRRGAAMPHNVSQREAVLVTQRCSFSRCAASWSRWHRLRHRATLPHTTSALATLSPCMRAGGRWSWRWD